MQLGLLFFFSWWMHFLKKKTKRIRRKMCFIALIIMQFFKKCQTPLIKGYSLRCVNSIYLLYYKKVHSSVSSMSRDKRVRHDFIIMLFLFIYSNSFCLSCIFDVHVCYSWLQNVRRWNFGNKQCQVTCKCVVADLLSFSICKSFNVGDCM